MIEASTFELYTAVNFFTVAVTMLTLILVVSGKILTRNKKLNFAITCVFLCLALIAEWFSFYGMNNHIRKQIIIAAGFELTFYPFIPVFLGQALYSGKLFKAAFGVALTNALLEMYSIFAGLTGSVPAVIYSVDADCIYHHEVLYFVYVIIFAVAALYTLKQAFNLASRFHSKIRFVLIPMLIFVSAGICLHYINFNLQIAGMSISFIIALGYIFYLELSQQVDGLTGLLNHLSYQRKTLSLRKNAMVFIFDTNDFKRANDKFGHLYGDQCLVVYAVCLRRAFEKYGLCYRIGGDEFCVLVFKKFNRVQNMIEKFFNYLDEYRKNDSNLPDISYGNAFYDHKKHDISSIISTADAVMYANKKQSKGQ